MHLDSTTSKAPLASTESRCVAKASTWSQAAPQTLRLNARQRSAVTLPLTAPPRPANLTVNISGPGGLAMNRNYVLRVRPATQILARRTVRPIAAREGLTLSNDLFRTSCRERKACRSRSASRAPTRQLAWALDRYPFGCSEQITSRACRCSMSTTRRARRTCRSIPRLISASATRSTLARAQGSNGSSTVVGGR